MHALDMEIFDDERFWAWVEAHNNDDPAKLRLAWHGREPSIDDAVRQIGMPAEISSGNFSMKYHTTGSISRLHFPENSRQAMNWPVYMRR